MVLRMCGLGGEVNLRVGCGDKTKWQFTQRVSAYSRLERYVHWPGVPALMLHNARIRNEIHFKHVLMSTMVFLTMLHCNVFMKKGIKIR